MGLNFKEKVAEYGTYESREQCTGLTRKNASTRKRAKRTSQTEANNKIMCFQIQNEINKKLPSKKNEWLKNSHGLWSLHFIFKIFKVHP